MFDGAERTRCEVNFAILTSDLGHEALLSLHGSQVDQRDTRLILLSKVTGSLIMNELSFKEGQRTSVTET